MNVCKEKNTNLVSLRYPILSKFFVVLLIQIAMLIHRNNLPMSIVEKYESQ